MCAGGTDFTVKYSNVISDPYSPSKNSLLRNLNVLFFFADMGNFVDTDQRKTVSQGHAALLNLLPIVSCPRPQVTWFREGHKIIPSSRM